MALTRYRLGELISQRREKYDGDDSAAYGVSSDGFISPKQEVLDKSLYNVFYKDDFVFNPARMELNSIAYKRLRQFLWVVAPSGQGSRAAQHGQHAVRAAAFGMPVHVVSIWPETAYGCNGSCAQVVPR